jgi:hypothetical protein
MGRVPQLLRTLIRLHYGNPYAKAMPFDVEDT